MLQSWLRTGGMATNFSHWKSILQQEMGLLNATELATHGCYGNQLQALKECSPAGNGAAKCYRAGMATNFRRWKSSPAGNRAAK